MRFNLYITIVNTGNSKQIHKLELTATFGKSNSGYGNNTLLMIKSMYEGNFEQMIDLRYDTSFDKEAPEVYIAKWIYNYWSGKNGSWDVKELKIIRDDRFKNTLN